jgi:hypothetical protein
VSLIETMHRGLIVCEHAVDERAILAQLREFDDRLKIGCEPDETYKRNVYVVVRQWSNEHDAAVICEWRDENGVPLPLSSRLVDKVKNLHVSSRAPQVDALAHNDALNEANRQAFHDASEDALRDAINRRGRIAAFHRSPALAAARRRARNT